MINCTKHELVEYKLKTERQREEDNAQTEISKWEVYGKVKCSLKKILKNE